MAFTLGRFGSHAVLRAPAVLLALGVGCGTALPASALTLSMKEFTCPIDGAKFQARVVNSFTQFGRRLDLKPVGALIAPAPRPVCPESGFVMYKDKFTDAEIDKLKAIVATDAFKQARAENTDYYMVGFVFERMEQPDPFAAGYIYLQALWEADAKPTELRQRYRALVLEKFAAYLQSADPAAGDKWWSAQLISAEMERQSGAFEKAVQRLAGLPFDQAPNPHYKRAADQIVGFAKQNDAAPREMR